MVKTGCVKTIKQRLQLLLKHKCHSKLVMQGCCRWQGTSCVWCEFLSSCYFEEGEKWSQFKPAVPPPDVNCVKLAKKQDVLKFLDELGVNQTVQKYYQDALSDANYTYVGIQDIAESEDGEGDRA